VVVAVVGFSLFFVFVFNWVRSGIRGIRFRNKSSQSVGICLVVNLNSKKKIHIIIKMTHHLSVSHIGK
jgi:hypothetical protein